MLDENKKEESVAPMSNETIIKLIGIGAVFLVMIIYILVSSKGTVNNNDKKPILIDLKDLVTLSKKVDNNYTLYIEKQLNDKSYNFSFNTDGNLTMYEGDIFDKEGIVVYGDKLFYLISKTKELKPYNGDKSFIDDLYYDYSFIISLFPKCELDQINDYKVKCTISKNDYLTEYNKKKDTGIEELEGNIEFMIVYNSSHITNITVDYSEINEAINGKNDSLNYIIKVNNVGFNNYDLLFDYYKSVLQK